MGIAEIFQSLHSARVEEDFIPLINMNEEQRKLIESKNYTIPTEENVQACAEYLEVNTDNMYLDIKGGFSPYVYFDGMVLVDMLNLDVEILETFQVKKKIEIHKKQINDYLENEKYESLFCFIDKKVTIMTYKSLYDRLPDDKKFEIFMDIYTRNEYGFSMFGHEFVEDVLKHNNKDDKFKRNLRKELKPDEFGYITIYRGMGSESTNLKNAYSWTTDLKTATFFSTRFSQEGQIYEAQVHIDNVETYYDGRNEKEVIVLPKNIKGTKKYIDFISLQEIVDNEDWLVDIYGYYNHEIDPDWFMNAEGIHGVTHAKRVLFLSLCLAHYNNLNSSDMDILIKASMYHDIGRTHDKTDWAHGVKSFSKAIQLGLVTSPNDESNDEDDKILRFVIECHSMSDQVAIKDVEKYGQMIDKERALRLLKLFKDADGLDRVRLGDLRFEFLRNEYAPRLYLVAKNLLQGIK